MDPWFTIPGNITKHGLRLHNGVYWKNSTVVVPDAMDLRQKILREFHDTMAGGHFGAEKTGYHLSKHYWWPRWGVAVREYCQQCTACQANEPRTIKLTPTPSKIQFPP